MLQIPVSDSRGEAGVNGVTFSVVPRARSGTLLLAARSRARAPARPHARTPARAIHRSPILDRQITRRGTTLHLNNSKHIFETLCPLLVIFRLPCEGLSSHPVPFGTFRVPGPEIRTADLSIIPTAPARSILSDTDLSDSSDSSDSSEFANDTVLDG